MRKILFGITIVALLIFTGFVMYQGTDGKLDVWGFTSISQENDIIDTKNSELKSKIEVDYPQALSTLDTSRTTLEKNKKEYEDQAILLADSKYFKQTEKYKHEFILTKIGNYADDNKVDIRIVVTNSSVAKLYDINFTLIGKYADVANYIYDIENDSKLGFKIEDFVMVSASGVKTNDDGTTTYTTNEVKANFNCKEISIDLKWLDENESVVPGIITRGNPFVNSMTTLTGDYTNDTLDTSRQQTGDQTTGTQAGTNTVGDGTSTGNGSATNGNTGNSTGTNETNTTGSGTANGTATNSGGTTGADNTTNTNGATNNENGTAQPPTTTQETAPANTTANQ